MIFEHILTGYKALLLMRFADRIDSYGARLFCQAEGIGLSLAMLQIVVLPFLDKLDTIAAFHGREPYCTSLEAPIVDCHVSNSTIRIVLYNKIKEA